MYKSGIIMVFLLVVMSRVASVAQVHDEYAAGLPDIAKSVQIFPNPAPDYVHVRNEQLKMQRVKVTLHNIIGNEITVEVETIDEHEIRLKVKDLAAGYYLLTIKDEDTKFRGTYKVLKR